MDIPLYSRIVKHQDFACGPHSEAEGGAPKKNSTTQEEEVAAAAEEEEAAAAAWSCEHFQNGNWRHVVNVIVMQGVLY